MKNTDLELVINEKLSIENFQDYAPNGLQVEGRPHIQKIVTGVTASQALLDEAVRLNADAILVHHGYFWKNEPVVIRSMKRNRLKTLLCNDINLFGYHLPLDAHPILGNNAQLALKMGVKVENKKQLPRINLTGNMTKDDRQIGIDVTWDIINFSSLYSVDEKVSQLNAAQQRMDRVIRDIEEARRLSVINIQKSTQKLKILDAQILSSTKVVDFYQLQFNVARRSLL